MADKDQIEVPVNVNIDEAVKNINKISQVLTKMVKDASVESDALSDAIEKIFDVTPESVSKLRQSLKAIDASIPSVKLALKQLENWEKGQRATPDNMAIRMYQTLARNSKAAADTSEKALKLIRMNNAELLSTDKIERQQVIVHHRKLQLMEAIKKSAGQYTAEVEKAATQLRASEDLLKRIKDTTRRVSEAERFSKLPGFQDLDTKTFARLSTNIQSMGRLSSLARNMEFMDFAQKSPKERESLIRATVEAGSSLSVKYAEYELKLKELNVAKAIAAVNSASGKEKQEQAQKSLEAAKRERDIMQRLLQDVKDAQRSVAVRKNFISWLRSSTEELSGKRFAPDATMADLYAARAREARKLSLFGSREEGYGPFLGVQAQIYSQFKILATSFTSITEVARQVSEFNKQLYSLQAISQSTRGELDMLTKGLMIVGQSFQFGSEEIAKASITLAQAGLSATEINKAIAAIAQLASATGSTLADAVDLTTTAMSVFNRQANEIVKVADEITAALNLTKLDVQKLALGLQYAGNVAADSKIEFTELVAAFGQLADSGIRSGSTLGTGIRQLIIDLSDPTEKLLTKLKLLGLSLNDVNIRSNGLIGVLKNMKDAGFTVADAMETMEVRASAAFSGLYRHIDELLELQVAINKGVSSLIASENQMESFTNKFIRLGNAIVNLAYSIFEPWATSMQPIIDKVLGITKALTEFMSTSKIVSNLIATFLVGSTITWAIRLTGLLNIIRTYIQTVPAMVAITKGLGAALGTIGLTLNPTLVVMGSLLTVMAALTGGFGLLKSRTQEFVERLDKLQTEINEARGAFDSTNQTLKALDDEMSRVNLRSARLRDNQDELALSVSTLESKFSNLGVTLQKNITSVEELSNQYIELKKNMLGVRQTDLDLMRAKTEQKKILLEQRMNEFKGEFFSSNIPQQLGSDKSGFNQARYKEFVDKYRKITQSQNLEEVTKFEAEIIEQENKIVSTPGYRQIYVGKLKELKERVSEYKEVLLEYNKVLEELEKIGKEKGKTAIAQQHGIIFEDFLGKTVRELKSGILDISKISDYEKRFDEAINFRERMVKKVKDYYEAYKANIQTDEQRKIFETQYQIPFHETIAEINRTTKADMLVSYEALKRKLNSEAQQLRSEIDKLTKLKNTRPATADKEKYGELASKTRGQLAVVLERLAKLEFDMREITSDELNAKLKGIRDSAAEDQETLRQYNLYYYNPVPSQRPEDDAVDIVKKRLDSYRKANEQELNSAKFDLDVLSYRKKMVPVPDFMIRMAEKLYEKAEEDTQRRNLDLYIETVGSLEKIYTEDAKKIKELQVQIDKLDNILKGKVSSEEGSKLEKRRNDLAREQQNLKDESGKAMMEIERLREEIEKIKRDLSVRNAANKPYSLREGLSNSAADWMDKNGLNKDFTENIIDNSQTMFNFLRDGIANVAETFILNTKKMGEGFKEFVRGVIESLVRAATQMLANRAVGYLLSWLFPQGQTTPTPIAGQTHGPVSVTPLPPLSQYLGGEIKKMSGGGKAVSTRDSVPALLQPGEFVLRSSAVKSIGPNELHRLNAAGANAKGALEKTKPVVVNNQPKPVTTNVWLVSQDQVPPPGPDDIIATVASNIVKGGTIKRLIKQVVS